MTIALYLDYGSAGIVSDPVYLSGGLSGFHLIDWVQGTPTGDSSEVVEVVTVAVEADDHDGIADILQPLDWLITKAEWARDDHTLGKRVRFWKKLDNETWTSSARVVSIETRFNRALNSPPTSPGNYIEEYTILVTREDEWTHNTGAGGRSIVMAEAGHIISSGSSQGAYIVQDYSGLSNGVVLGTGAARLNRLKLAGHPGGYGPWEKIWIGFRTERYGARSRWEPIWNAVSYVGGLGSGTTAVYDSGGYPNTGANNVIEIDSAATTLVERSRIILGDQTQYVREQRGTFIVLMRAKCTGTETYQVQMSHGVYYPGEEIWIRQSRIAVDVADWYLYPMGIVSFPLSDSYSAYSWSATFMDTHGIKIESAVLAAGGAGDKLQIDFFAFCPISEGHLTVSGAEIEDGKELHIFEDDGILSAVNYIDTAGTPGPIPLVSSTKPTIPAGAGSLFILGQRSSSHYLLDRVYPTVTYASTFRTLRGDQG